MYKNTEYRDKILDILEKKLVAGKPDTGRPGMPLWEIFVLAQVRLSKHLSYDELALQANYNRLLRQVMGVARVNGIEEETYPYQTIVDNVNLLDNETLKDINTVIVSFGEREVFKKKRNGSIALRAILKITYNIIDGLANNSTLVKCHQI